MKKTDKFEIKLNNTEKIEKLLQETYDIAVQQHNSIQNEMNKIVNTTAVSNLDIDGKEKYAKIMANYISLMQKTNAQKQDIAKLMAEVVKHNGDVSKALDDAKKAQANTLDFDKLRKLATSVNSNQTETEVYETKH